MAPTCFWWRGSLIRDHLRVSKGGAAGDFFPDVRRGRQCMGGAASPFVALLGGVSRSGLFALQSAPANRMRRLPHVILWAWERHEDLSFIDPRKVGVAYLAGTLYLRGDRVVIRPMRQPLIVPEDSFMIPVVRI